MGSGQSIVHPSPVQDGSNRDAAQDNNPHDDRPSAPPPGKLSHITIL